MFSHCPGDRRQHRPRGRQGPRRRERWHQRGTERRWGVGLGAACGTREATGGVKGSCRCGGSQNVTWIFQWILCMDWFTVIRKEVGVWNVSDFHSFPDHPKMLWHPNGYLQISGGIPTCDLPAEFNTNNTRPYSACSSAMLNVCTLWSFLMRQRLTCWANHFRWTPVKS